MTSSQIKLGLVYPDTGTTSAVFDGSRAGIEARLGLANAEGGINGRKIVYDWRDDQGDVTTNDRVVRDLVENSKVFGLVESTTVASGGAAYLHQENVPVTGLESESVWSQYPNMFSFVYATGGAIDTYGRYVSTNGGTRAVVIQPPFTAATQSFTAELSKSLQAANVPVVRTVTFTDGVDDPSSAARSIIDAKANSVVGIADPKVLAEILQALQASGSSPKVILSFTGYGSDTLHRFGSAMAGVSIPLFFLPFEAGGPALDRYREAVRRYAPELGNPDQEFALRAYIETDMFLRGLQAAGSCPTRGSFIRSLHGVTDYSAGGLIQPIDVKNGFGKQQTCYAFVRVNAAGTAFDVADQRLCGNIITN